MNQLGQHIRRRSMLVAKSAPTRKSCHRERVWSVYCRGTLVLLRCTVLPGSLEDLSCAGSTGRGDKMSVRMTRGKCGCAPRDHVRDAAVRRSPSFSSPLAICPSKCHVPSTILNHVRLKNVLIGNNRQMHRRVWGHDGQREWFRKRPTHASTTL